MEPEAQRNERAPGTILMMAGNYPSDNSSSTTGVGCNHGSLVESFETAEPATPGERLGPYEVISPIGRGGMGQVFLAKDTRLDLARSPSRCFPSPGRQR